MLELTPTKYITLDQSIEKLGHYVKLQKIFVYLSKSGELASTISE